jgi:hypothetical protein
MKPIQLESWSDFPATHFIGELVRQEITEALSVYESVEIDCGGLKGMGPSFADECFGVLFSEHGSAFLRAKLNFKGITEDMKQVIRIVIAQRKGRAVA